MDMLKPLTALLACFLSSFGPPSLPVPPPAAPPPGPREAATAPAPESFLELTSWEPLVEGTVFKHTACFSPLPRSDLDRLIKKYARRHGVAEKLVRAVLRQESGGNPQAVSPKGAMGLMQLMPETAALLGVENAFDPEENLAGGVKYLKFCLERFHQDTVLALAAYNAGPGAVGRYGGVPPFPETRQYVASILGEKAVPPSSAVPPARRTNPPQEIESSPEAGLSWNLPQPTWKVLRADVKVPAPQWKACPPASRLRSMGSLPNTRPARKTKLGLFSRRTKPAGHLDCLPKTNFNSDRF